MAKSNDRQYLHLIILSYRINQINKQTSGKQTMNIKKSIRICLAIEGMTMPELAEKMDVSITRAYKLADNPTAKTISKIAEVFNMKASEFLAVGEDK